MLTMVVGGQYGGEGKGKVSAYLAKADTYSAVCRCGGINSSHTVVENGKILRLRLMPAASAVRKGSNYLFGPGTLLHIPTLFHELDILGVDASRVFIDPRAGIVTDNCIQSQRNDPRYENIGSTLTGTGYASAQRCMRSLPLAREFSELKPMLRDVSDIIHSLLFRRPKKGSILVEGHQGFGLSNYHGDYPYTSSRDCTSSALLSEIGVGPIVRANMRIVLAVKAFPTRNHAGNLPEELSLDEADKLGIREFGGGSWGISDNRRRVGIIDFDLVAKAARVNAATEIALTGADYLDHSILGATEPLHLTETVRDFIEALQRVTKVRVSLISTGPETDAMIDLNKKGNELKNFDSDNDLLSRAAIQ